MRFILIISWVLLVMVHHVICIAVGLAPVVAILMGMPGYVVLSYAILLCVLAFRRTPCSLTTLENKIRKKLGKPEISTFSSHYYLGKD